MQGHREWLSGWAFNYRLVEPGFKSTRGAKKFSFFFHSKTQNGQLCLRTLKTVSTFRVQDLSYPWGKKSCFSQLENFQVRSKSRRRMRLSQIPISLKTDFSLHFLTWQKLFWSIHSWTESNNSATATFWCQLSLKIFLLGWKFTPVCQIQIEISSQASILKSLWLKLIMCFTN